VTQKSLDKLAPRERQIMEIVYRLRRATAAEVHEQLADAPTYTSVRGMLRLLESKGYVRHDQEGPRYVYFPVADRGRVSKSALQSFVRTFFDDSASAAVSAMVGMYEDDLTEDALDELEAVVERARKKASKR
jgi:predicted transcriptional regulator